MSNYVYNKCKNGAMGSEYVTLPKQSKAQDQQHFSTYPRNPYEGVMMDDFQHYDI